MRPVRFLSVGLRPNRHSRPQWLTDFYEEVGWFVLGLLIIVNLILWMAL